MPEFEPVLLKNVQVPDVEQIDAYRGQGGYRATERALKELSPDDVVGIVRKAGLRGRGGAGFPCGVKWGFLPKDRTTTYMCVNADESEPCTFNNRILMERDPHQLLEGAIIASYATQASVAYIYIRYEFAQAFHVLQRAINEAYEAGFLGQDILGTGFGLDVYLHRGAAA